MLKQFLDWFKGDRANNGQKFAAAVAAGLVVTFIVKACNQDASSGSAAPQLVATTTAGELPPRSSVTSERPRVSVTSQATTSVPPTPVTTPVTVTSTTEAVPTTSAAPLSHFMDDLEPVEGGHWVADQTEPIRSSGLSYGHAVAIKFSGCESEVAPAWNLGRSYSTFHGILGINDGQATTDARALVVISTVEGGEIWRGEVGLGAQIPLDLNVSNAVRLIITVTRLAGGHDCGMGSANNFVVIGDAQLLPAPSTIVQQSGYRNATPTTFLKDLAPAQNSYWVADDLPSITSSGATYNHAIAIKFSGCESEVAPTWYLGRSFTTFHGVLGLNDEKATTDARALVVISTTDNGEIWRGEVGLGTQTPLDLNVSNALRLVITVTRLAGGHDCGMGSAQNYLVVGDGQLIAP